MSSVNKTYMLLLSILFLKTSKLLINPIILTSINSSNFFFKFCDIINAGCVDAGCVNTGCVNTGCVDAGCVNTGCVDAGCVDAGCVDAGCVNTGCVDAFISVVISFIIFSISGTIFKKLILVNV